MLFVGDFVSATTLSSGKEICSIPKDVAVLWIIQTCMPVKPANATAWLQVHGPHTAIVIQSKGYRFIAIDHWDTDKYRLVEIPVS